jgi:hypothetical protein
MENSPIAFALYCDRQLVLVLVLVFALLQGCFQSKPEARVYLVTVKLTQLVRFQISDFRIREEEGGGVSTRRRVSHSTPSLMQRKHFVSVYCKYKCRVRTDR